MKNSLTTKISSIPGPDGWYKSSSEKTYNEAADVLANDGWNEDEIISFLEKLYRATADCYGD